MQLKKIGLFIAVLLCCTGYAQSPKKAVRDYGKALKYWAATKETDACNAMEKAIALDPENAEYYTLLGHWYFDRHLFDRATEVFRMGFQKGKYGRKRFAEPLARCMIFSGKPDSALWLMSANPGSFDEASLKSLKAKADFVKGALSNSAYLFPVNLGIRLNTRYAEMFPVVSRDQQTLYFTRRINKLDEDIFVAKADSCGGWLRADNAGPIINSPNEERATCISSDGHYLFFTRCGIKSDNGWDGGGCDLYMSYRVSTDSVWYFPEPFGATINSPAYEGMPSLSPDNRELYFVSDRPGGYGGTDIWIAKFEDGLWQLPVNAGPLINTAGNEAAPFIGEDNRTLYYSSDGLPGMGGFDLFVARKKTDSTWDLPMNLGYPVNTAFDEVSACVAGNGSKLYFASDRYAKKGNFDLYETDLPSRLRPEPVCYIHGYVYDSISKERLNDASMYIMDFTRGDTIYRFQSNRGDGSYVMLLRTGYKYLIHTARPGYTPVNDTLSLEFDHPIDSIQHNVDMLASDYLAPIHDSLLATIHFDLNKVELTASDKQIIRDAINPWLLEKRYVLHINGYTDNTGTPMLNEELSTKRAKLVTAEIMNMGIDELIIETHGWGEAKMIAPNDNEEHQKMNRRVEITLSR